LEPNPKSAFKAKNWVLSGKDRLSMTKTSNFKRKYPKSWAKMSRIVKFLSKNRCENCGAEDNRESGHLLTVHHLNFNTFDNRYSNLVALCQRCHLFFTGCFHPAQLWLFDVKPDWAKKRGL